MAKEYTIHKVSPKVDDWSGAHGPMKSYYVLLFGEGQEPIKVNKKPASDPPKPGDVIYGDLEPGQFGVRFKPVNRGQYNNTSQTKPVAASNSRYRGSDDNYTMYLAYAKDLAVAKITMGDPEVTEITLDAVADLVLEVADKLYNHHAQ